MKYGLLSRILTLVVCVSPQFEHVPLYLEWAPVGVFKAEKASSQGETEEPRTGNTEPGGEGKMETLTTETQVNIGTVCRQIVMCKTDIRKTFD